MQVDRAPSTRPSIPLSEPTDVLLVSMPFGPHVLHPSIGLSLLKGAINELGASSKILYLTLRLAEKIGDEIYRAISYSEPTTLGFSGEWLFSHVLFPEEEHDVEAFVDQVLRWKSPDFQAARRVDRVLPEKSIERILKVRPLIAEFMDECVEEVLRHRPRIVGLTTTFQQHAGSLALARRLKLEDESLFIVMGGANCEGIMGYETLRQFKFLDAVVSGEADVVFPELVQGVLRSGRAPEIRGVFTRAMIDASRPASALQVVRSDNTEVSTQTTAPVHDMDGLPYPDYEDFFGQFRNTELELANLDKEKAIPRLMFETSRGCWWGAKSHCTFCGLNGGTMAFRSKSADRAMAELKSLLGQYPGSSVSVVDNILDMKYFRDFVPELAESGLDTELFYEVKSNLSKKQLVMMRDAGILSIQPGIESLSSHVLGLMKKGVSGLQNVQLLKWCKELGIRPFWNMLWGFPGETPENYEEVLEWMPLLTHLPPPGGHGLIRLDRFSPNFDQAEEFGFAGVRPYPAFDHIYKSLSEEARFNMSYFFTYHFRDGRNPEDYIQEVRKGLDTWREEFDESDVFTVDKGDRLLVWDLRPVAKKPLTVLTGVSKALFETTDGICGLSKLQRVLAKHTGRLDVTLDDVEEAIQPFFDAGLFLQEDQQVLNVGIPLGAYSPPGKVIRKFERIVQDLGGNQGPKVVIDLDKVA